MAIIHPTSRFHSNLGPHRFGDYLSGLTDGEGSFVLGAFPRKDPRYGINIRMMAIFKIVIRTDDKPILENIREFFGCGNIAVCKPAKRIKNAKSTTAFYISKPEENVEVVIPHFEEHPLQAKKQYDFLIWRQGVELLYRVTSRKLKRRKTKGGFLPRWTEEERNQFQALVLALKDQRLYEPPPTPIRRSLPSNGSPPTQGLLFKD